MSSCWRVNGNSSGGGAGAIAAGVAAARLAAGRSAGESRAAGGEVGEQERDRRLDHHRARHQIAAAQPVLVEQGHQGEHQQPGRGEQPPPAGRLGEHLAGRQQHHERDVELQVPHDVAGEDRLRRERPAVPRDHPQLRPALAERHPAPVHLEVDEVEIPEQKADQHREGGAQLRHPDEQAEGRQQPDRDRRANDQQRVEQKGAEAVASRGHHKRERQPFRGQHPVDTDFIEGDRAHGHAPRKGSTRSRRPASSRREPSGWRRRARSGGRSPRSVPPPGTW